VYVVVPKCRRCFSSLDNLDTIAKLYDAKWLDVWSVNHALIRTTQVHLSSDEAFNTAKDQSYLLVEKAHAIKLGVAYKMASTDHLTTVATRFGMRLSSLMALNPDIVAANQDSNFVGKQVPH
jgi:LysM repeat protein